jgi:hypothetical protein
MPINNDPSVNPDAQVAASQQSATQPTQQPPVATPTAATPVAPNPAAPLPTPQTPAQGQQPDPHTQHVNLFSKILGMVNPGQTYVDANGQPQTIRNRATLGNSVIASVLAGMMTPTQYRKGEYGDVVSGDATAAGAYQAGRGQQMAQNDAAQKQSDEMQTKKLAVISNNLTMAHQYAALAQQQHADLQQVADRNNATILKDLGDYDQTQNDPTQKLVLGKGLTWDQAMSQMKGKLSSQNAVIDGYQDVMDPATHQMTVQPTFTVLNPDAKINMSESAAAELAKFKPAYKNAYALTDGNIRVPVTAYLSDLHTANSLSAAESFMRRADVSLGIDPKSVDFAGTVQKDPRVLQSVKEAENALAQGGSTADVLDRIQKSPNGGVLLDAMGLNGDKVQKYIDDTRNAQKAAERDALALGDKAPADADALAQIPVLAKQMGLSPAEASAATAELPKKGATRADVAKVLENIRHQHDTNLQLAASANRDSGDPAMIERVARNLVDNPNNLTTMRDIGTRGTQRLAIIDKAEQIAQAEGKQFDTGLINQRVKFLEQYEDPKGKAAINRQAINNIMQHAADVSDLNELNRRSNMKVVNTPINALKDQFGDSVYTQYQTATNVLKDELGLYFAGGYSPTKTQQETWDKIQSDTATPAQTEAFAKEVIRLATRRANTFNEQFKTNMGVDDPNMITPQAKSAAERLGLSDEVKQFGVGGQLGQQRPSRSPRMVTVQIPGQPSGQISADKVAAFRTKYPNAIVGQVQ